MEILPALTAVTDVTTNFFAVISANIVPILGLLGVSWGVRFATRHLYKAGSKAR